MKRRFVVQRHDERPGADDYDFMVEKAPGEQLATWKLEQPLGPTGGERSSIIRAIYLDYEGEISGGRGSVTIVERGTLEDEEGDPEAARYVFRIGERRFEVANVEGTRESVRRLG